MDMGTTIAPKSAQLNADDLLAGPRDVKITRVEANSSPEQPVSVHFDGDDGKPYLPCKSMRRVMVALWGRDTAEYLGRSMRIYRDPKVLWGGMEVGGIRISHMSHIERETTIALTATSKTRKPFTVKPLTGLRVPLPAEQLADGPAEPAADDKRAQAEKRLLAGVEALIAEFDAVTDGKAFYAIVDRKAAQEQRTYLREKRPDMSERVEAAVRAADARTNDPPAANATTTEGAAA